MTLSQSTRSPLARLVLFMVCLSIAGSIVAGAHYYAVDLPRQNAVTAPENNADTEVGSSGTCGNISSGCYMTCDKLSQPGQYDNYMCKLQCDTNYWLCMLVSKT